MNRLASTLGPTLGYRVFSTAAVLWLITSVDVSAQFAMPPAAPPASTAVPAASASVANGQSLITQCRAAISRRDFTSAVQLYRQAVSVSQSATGPTQAGLLAETNKLKTELLAVGMDASLLALPPQATALAQSTPLQALGDIAAQPLPSAASLADRKREALKLVAIGRAALDRGDVLQAFTLAKRADAFKVPEIEFAAGEPRVWQLLLDAESAARRAGIDVSKVAVNSVAQASATSVTDAASPVQQAGGFPTGQTVASFEGMFNNQGTNGTGTIQQVQNLSPLSSGASPGERLFRQGLDALSIADQETARAKFIEAWKYESQLDPTTRQQLKDKLTLLQPTKLPSPDQPTGPLTAIQKADLQAQQMTSRLYRELTTELASAEQISKEEPMLALSKLEALRRRVEGSEVEDAAKQSMSGMVGRAIAEQKGYIEANRADIELKAQNAAVKADMANEDAKEARIDEEIISLVATYNELMKERRFPEAEVVAKQVGELKPGSEIAMSMMHNSRMGTRLMINEDIRNMKEVGFTDTMLDAELSMVPPTSDYSFAKDFATLSVQRLSKAGDRRGSPAELEIYRKIDTPVSVKYKNRPLGEVLEELSAMSGINMVLDERALSALRITPDTPVTLQIPNSIPLKSALNLILDSLELTYVIDNDVMNITSMEVKRSKTYAKVYRVTDLVTPIPNFTTGYEDGLAGALQAAYRMADRRNDVQIMPVSMTDLGSGMAKSMNPAQMSPNMLGQYHPMGSGGFASAGGRGGGGLGGGAFADFDSLMTLIQQTISPDTWDTLGGPSTMAPYQQNLSLVISTTSDVHDQIVELLESLRRLQNLQITIEVRFITLSDSFFEQIGVDFDMSFDDNVNTIPGDDSGPSVTVGISQGGIPTADFDLKLDTTNTTQPAFGSPDLTGGSSIGFAILSDIESYFFLRAAQGDNRTNVMQAPKVTLFDGQIATISDQSQRPFVTSITPVVGDFAVAQQPVIVVLSEGTQLNVQGVVSDDKRYVRLTLVPFFSQIGDVDTFTYEGSRTTSRNSQTRQDTNGDGVIDSNDDSTSDTESDVISGTTVQLPTFASTSVSTTVSVPDGGTILLGGIKRMAEGRAERGTPFLSKIPYVSRLFRNVSIGRDARSLMLMVTPRIIIQEEEEVAQTGFEANR